MLHLFTVQNVSNNPVTFQIVIYNILFLPSENIASLKLLIFNLINSFFIVQENTPSSLDK